MNKIKISAISLFLLAFLVAPTAFAQTKSAASCQATKAFAKTLKISAGTTSSTAQAFCGKDLNKTIKTSIGNFTVKKEIVERSGEYPIDLSTTYPTGPVKVSSDTLLFSTKTKGNIPVDLKYGSTAVAGGIDEPEIVSIIDLKNGTMLVSFKGGNNQMTLISLDKFYNPNDATPAEDRPLLSKTLSFLI